MGKTLSQKSVTAAKWNTISQLNGFFLKFTLGVILARLLSPEEFGLIALITVVTEISNFFIDGGFSASLIQNKNIDNRDFTTVFYFNVFLGIFFTLLFFLCAPLFSNFYNDPRLESITRILSSVYVLNSVSVVHKAYFIRSIDFRHISIIEIITQSSSGLLGIGLAIGGFGYWALVWKRVFESLAQSILYFYYSDWRPIGYFNWMILKKHWNFSAKILLANIFKQISDRLDLIVVGKVFSSVDLAIFQRGKNYAFLPVNFASSVINRTLFSSFSKLQDDKIKFLKNYIRVFRIISFFVLPVISLLFLNSEEFILILIGIKWIEVGPLLKLFSVAGFLYIMNVNKLNLLAALSFPKYAARFNLIETIIKPTIVIAYILISDQRQIEVIAVIFIIFYLFRFIYSSFHLALKLNTSFTKIGFSNWRELIIVFSSTILSYFIVNNFSNGNYYWDFIISVSSFLVIYILLVYFFLREMITEISKLKNSIIERKQS